MTCQSSFNFRIKWNSIQRFCFVFFVTNIIKFICRLYRTVSVSLNLVLIQAFSELLILDHLFMQVLLRSLATTLEPPATYIQSWLSFLQRCNDLCSLFLGNLSKIIRVDQILYLLKNCGYLFLNVITYVWSLWVKKAGKVLISSRDKRDKYIAKLCRAKFYSN